MFTSEGQKKNMKGNQNAKKPIEKELAQHACWQELFYCAQKITNTSVKDLEKDALSDKIKEESLMTWLIIKKAIKGDSRPIQWMTEMIVGKPKQQLDHTGALKSVIMVDKEDMNL